MARLLLIILVTVVSFVASNNDEESDHLQHSEQLQSQESGLRSVRHGERSIREASSEENAQKKKRRRLQQRSKSKKAKSKNKKKEKMEQTNPGRKPGKGKGGRKSSKRNNKMKNSKKKKSKNKNSNNGEKNVGKKKGENQRKPSAKQAESKPITKECLTNILTAIKLRTKGTNYKKQHDRITKFEKTGKNKLSKKDQFSSVAEKLVDVGGGNKDELKCGSEGSSGAGAKSLKEAITELEACDAELKTKCDTSTYSIPPTAEVEKCKTNFEEINKVLSECDKLNPDSTSPDKQCECYNGNGADAAKWKEMLAEAKACKVLKTFNDKTTTAHKACTKAFKKCTSAKKDSPKLLFSCSQTTAALKKKAAAAKKNADAVKKAKEKSAKLAGSSRQVRSDISTPGSCADVIKTNKELATEAGKGKTNTKVATLGTAIAATPDTVTCSTEEKTSLKEQVTLLDAIVTALEAFVKELKEAIKTATGSEPTDSELDNVDTSSSSTTTKKAVLRRDRIVKNLLARM